MVKLSGAEYKAFLDSDWGGLYMDYYVISVNGVTSEQDYIEEVEDRMKPSDRVIIHAGGVYGDCGFVASLETFYKLWKKSQTHEILVVQVPKTNLAAMKAAIKVEGGKVV